MKIVSNISKHIGNLMKNFKKIIHREVTYPIKKMLGIIDIKGSFDYPSCALSNCAKEPYVFSFIIDGVKCQCMEAFLQSLKCSELEKQTYICSLTWRDAQKEGRTIDWTQTQTLWWNGNPINRHSKEYQDLLDKAYDALMIQNEGYRKALLDSGNARLIHTIGSKSPEMTVLTENEFCSRLMTMRNKLQNL